MKIAISTCQTGMIESLSAMFSEHEWHVLGIIKPRSDWPFHMAVAQQFGRTVYNHYQEEEPIQDIDEDDYDLLIDVAESNDYNSGWREEAEHWTVPRIIYITNPAPKTLLLREAEKIGGMAFRTAQELFSRPHPIFRYYRKLERCPIVYSNETLQRDWGLRGTVIHFTFDEWGVGSYLGDEPVMLYGKNGYYTWSKPEGTPLEDLFARLEHRFGDRLVIHDSSREPINEQDWRDYVSHKRLWFEHDFGSTGRALTQGVVKAMCLGLPVIVWKTRISCADRFIENGANGLVAQSVDEAWDFASKLFGDYELARMMSKEMVKVYHERLSWKVAKPSWELRFKEAMEVGS